MLTFPGSTMALDMLRAEAEQRHELCRAELSARLACLDEFIDATQPSGAETKPPVMTSRETTVSLEKPTKREEGFGIEYLYEMFERKDLNKYSSLGGAEGLMSKVYFDVNTKKGADSNSIIPRREEYGDNVLPQAEMKSFMDHIKEALEDTMMQILCGAAFISLVLGLTVPDPHTGKVEYATGWIEGAAILVSVVVVVFVTAINNYTKGLKFAQLSAETSKRNVNVIRDGYKQEVDTTELVVGDILYVNSGDLLPCDALFIDGVECKADESAITGESDIVEKDSVTDPFFIAGTSLMTGAGTALVTGVGHNSSSGRQLKLTLEGGEQETPLQVDCQNSFAITRTVKGLRKYLQQTQQQHK